MSRHVQKLMLKPDRLVPGLDGPLLPARLLGVPAFLPGLGYLAFEYADSGSGSCVHRFVQSVAMSIIRHYAYTSIRIDVFTRT